MNYLLQYEEKFRSLQSNAAEMRGSDGDSQQSQQGGGQKVTDKLRGRKGGAFLMDWVSMC